MIKNILFDFDGVILDSMKIKGDGFVELFEEYDDKYIKIIEKYHYENGGMSRFDKIKYFYNSILKEEVSDNNVISLSNKFSKIIQIKLYNKNNLIQETIDFIKKNHKKYNLHIVSGAEHDELNRLCKYFKITKYFITIDGSPTKKAILIKNKLDQYNYNKNETILIGDAINDYNAANNNQIKFYGYNNVNLINMSDLYIFDFKETIL